MLKIKGNNLLTGKIKVQGSKNSSLALIVASLLIKGNVKLTNVPKIEDENSNSGSSSGVRRSRNGLRRRKGYGACFPCCDRSRDQR